MRRIVAVAVVMMMLTGTAGVAIAHTFVANTALTIHKVPGGSVKKGTTIVIYGKLKSSRAFCHRNRVVDLMKVRKGNDKVLDKDRTDGEGEYLFVRQATKDEKVYTKFKKLVQAPSYGHSHTCNGSRSETIKIDVK